MKQWLVAPEMPAGFREKFPEVSSVVLQLLYNRGLDTQEKIDEFFNPDYETDLHDPWLFRDMPKVVERIFLAVEHGEKITVYGDYDADGVSSSVLMTIVLRQLIKIFGNPGKVDESVDVFIPHRERDGYGLKMHTVAEVVKSGANLIITVDCGISGVAEVAWCKDQGVEVIITDHHQAPEVLPPAIGIINPQVAGEKYPFKNLAGVGVAFKVAQALISEAKKRQIDGGSLPAGQAGASGGNWEGFEKWLLDLVAIGTVSDIMPLLGENRTLVRYGLVVLNKTPRLGLQTLFLAINAQGSRGKNGYKDTSQKPGFNSYSIAFQIAPRLNAAGRMDHANTAYALLLATELHEAERLAEMIEDSNGARQVLTEQIVAEAQVQLAEQKAAKEDMLVVLGDGWPTGVLGLVAGRLEDRYGKAVAVASEFDGKIVGSGRSSGNFDLMVLLRSLDKYFANYGGHTNACGFTLKKKEDFFKFKKELQELAHQQAKNTKAEPTLEIEAVLTPEDASWALWDELEKMEPFGEANESPLFLMKDLTVEGVEKMGKDATHLRVIIRQANGLLRKMVAFSFAGSFGHLVKGDKIEAVVSVGVNEWNGNRELQLKIFDLKKIDS